MSSGSLNCAAFIGGIIEAILVGSNFVSLSLTLTLIPEHTLQIQCMYYSCKLRNRQCRCIVEIVAASACYDTLA